MTYGGDPFGDPFAPQDFGPPTSYGSPTAQVAGWQFGGPQGPYGAGGPSPSPQPSLNTFAVLSPIFGVLIPPAGVAFGHLALPQIKRTGQRGWLSAVCGLVIGYLMSLALIAGLIWFFGIRESDDAPATTTTTTTAAPPTSTTRRSTVVTSVAPPPNRPRTKIALEQATVGKCVEIQKRDDSGPDALDLFEVPCEHRDGVYSVVARVSGGSSCNSTYSAAPPDRAFAVCLNKY